MEGPIGKHIPSDPIEYVHKGSLIEDIIEDRLHDIIIETIENLEFSHDYFIDNDHSFSPDLPQEETITKAYKETYDKICMVLALILHMLMKVWKFYVLITFLKPNLPKIR